MQAGESLATNCQALAIALPRGAYFSHVTAARLWPLPIPGPRDDEPLHVSVPAPIRAPRHRGVRGHQCSNLATFAVQRGGLQLPDPASLFCQLAGLLSLDDLVYEKWRVIVEYDGDQHRSDTRQCERDVGRLDDLANAGWRVVRILGRSFFRERRASMARIERALRDAGWRP